MDITTYALCKKIAESSGSGLPPVTASDNGKVLTVENGAWSAQQKKFVVTLTPTAADFSGVMDKTPQEITAAYNAGKEIVLEIPSMSAVMHATQFMGDGSGNIMVGVSIIYNSFLIMLTTSNVDDSNQYSTAIYPLTPAT